MPKPTPESVPIQQAATVMILDDRPDLHVLMLRRRTGSEFVGGMDVFPGGAVDPGDAEDEVEALCAGLDDDAASARLGVERGGLAYWVAAARETFEESGVLLARDAASGLPFDPFDAAVAERLAAERRAVDAGELRLAEVVKRADLMLTVDVMHYCARWITPPGPPRRYDTRFFVTAMPEGQTPVPDRREAVDSAWLRPGDVLRDFEAGRRALLPPTAGMLGVLASYESADEVIRAAVASEEGADEPVRVVAEGGSWRVLLPGDGGGPPPAAARELALYAWSRLRVRSTKGSGA